MPSDSGRVTRSPLFSLVSYLPDPLATLLDALRQELVPNSRVRSHVTVLPPRELAVGADAALLHISGIVPLFPSFEIELTEIRRFPVSDVVYVDIGAGADALREIHAVLNHGTLEALENFEYCPHVTLAQEFPPGGSEELVEIARRRWAEYTQSRRFRVEILTFVRNTGGDQWVDLGQCRLATGGIRLLEPTGTR